jgi:two-component system, NtrC family, response regulator PilR
VSEVHVEGARLTVAPTRAKSSVQLIGRSAEIVALQQELERIARSDAKVLITGESGVGKEIVAHNIHGRGPRANMPFAPVNCAGLPETLLESELFGHVKGSFTGAYRDKPGKLEAAHMGTAFLDEIGEMTLRMQGMLLRFLETGELQKVGADGNARHVNVRVIAATNRNLREMITQGTFREDLFYRLNVIHIAVPPLRDRREDIPVLAQHFLEKFSPTSEMQVSQDAMRALMAYPWPGNVRQLENAVERAVALSAGRRQVELTDLPGEVHVAPPSTQAPFVELPEDGLDLPGYLAAIERDLIQRSLDRTGGNRNRAAELLHIKRTTLVEKLKRFGQ